MLTVTTAHEFAHGLACKHFGGEVHEIGFLLLYFQPAFYRNVSDAWLFAKKSQRLWVTFAGAYLPARPSCFWPDGIEGFRRVQSVFEPIRT